MRWTRKQIDHLWNNTLASVLSRDFKIIKILEWSACIVINESELIFNKCLSSWLICLSLHQQLHYVWPPSLLLKALYCEVLFQGRINLMLKKFLGAQLAKIKGALINSSTWAFKKKKNLFSFQGFKKYFCHLLPPCLLKMLCSNCDIHSDV